MKRVRIITIQEDESKVISTSASSVEIDEVDALKVAMVHSYERVGEHIITDAMLREVEGMKDVKSIRRELYPTTITITYRDIID